MGEHFGRYQLLRRLAVGGMAEVYLARTHGPEGFVKDVVIKRILPALNQDPAFVEMFINEARLAAKLQHANIVQIFDFNHVDGVYYIAMEYVDGTDLRQLQRTARRRALPIPTNLAVHVGVEALKGMNYAHGKSEGGLPLDVVHRDISPHNLLVSCAAEVKIADFGIAKAAALASATRTGAVKGKVPYMSPEQIRGERIDHRSDLFSLGIVIWELLSGRRPYADVVGESELEAAVRRAAVPRLQQANPDLPPELDAVVHRLLEVDPAGRYQSAAAALADLGGFVGVTDALAASRFLERLMPELAERHRKGDTAVESVAHLPEAPPDAVTRTQTPRSVRAGPPSLQPGAGPTRRRWRWRRALAPLALLGLFTAAAAVAYGVTYVLQRSRHRGQRSTLQAAKLVVTTEPPGALVTVDGVRVGRSPATVFGAKNARVLVEARIGSLRGEKSASLARGTVRIVLARSRRAGVDAGRRRAAGPDAQAAPERRRARRSTTTRRRPAGPRRRGRGFLEVIVAPWATVYVDGKRIGDTPIKRHPLPAGRHRLRLQNAPMGRVERTSIRVWRGRTTRVQRRFLR